MESAPGEITLLLSQIKAGDPVAAVKLADYVYAELRRLAGSYMRGERADHTLQPTALVNETFLRLIGSNSIELNNRAHFLALAAKIMRQVLVEYARQRNTAKRGGLQSEVALEDHIAGPLNTQIHELIDLDDALKRLAEKDVRLSRVVELRYFGGLSIEETAEVLGVSSKTVKRDWTLARAWLKTELGR